MPVKSCANGQKGYCRHVCCWAFQIPNSTNFYGIRNAVITSLLAWTSAAACGRKEGRALAQSCSMYSRHVFLGTKPDTRPSGRYLGASRMSASCLSFRRKTVPTTAVDWPPAPAMIAPVLPAADPCCRRTLYSTTCNLLPNPVLLPQQTKLNLHIVISAVTLHHIRY